MPLLKSLLWGAAATVGVMTSALANDWSNLATISMTDPVTPKLTNRYICYTDGRDIRCDSPSLYVSTGGLVGINTSNPNAQLDVYGTVSATNFIGDGSGLTGISTQGDRIVSGTAPFTQMLAVSDSRYISITQGGANTAWFDPGRGLVTLGVSSTGVISGTGGFFTGKVGVGRVPSNYELEVSGSGVFIGDYSPAVGVSSSTGRGFFALATNNNAYLDSVVSAGDLIVRSGGGASGVGANLVLGVRTPSGSIKFSTGAPGAMHTEKMRISSDGNVGVGTQAPAATLQVSGTFIVSNSTQMPASPSIFVASNGWVGFGTDSPTTPLSYVMPGVGGQSGFSIRNSSWSGADWRLYHNAADATNDYGLVFQRNGVNYLTLGGQNDKSTIFNFSNVGIGGSPNVSLTVVGEIQVSNSGVVCNSARKGAIRYSNTSSTIEYCQGSEWTDLRGVGAVDGFSSVYNSNPSLNTTSACPTFVDVGGSSKSVVVTSSGVAVLNWSAAFYASGAALGGRVQACIGGSCGGASQFYFNNVNYHHAIGGSYVANIAAGTHTVKLQACVTTGSGTFRADGGDYVSWNVIMPSSMMSSGGGGGGATPAGSAGDIQFNDGTNLAADTGRLFWDATNKRLGIGTGSPGNMLDVAHSYPTIRLTDTTAATLTDVGGRIEFTDSSGNLAGVIGPQGNSSEFVIRNLSGGRVALTPGSTGVLTALNSGRVGIGWNVLSPTATLQVSGSFIVSTSEQTTTPTLYVGANGNVGIGTSNPGGRFAVESTDAVTPMSVMNPVNDSGVSVQSRAGYGLVQGVTYAGNPGVLVLNAFGTNVGIARTSPSAKLDVNGTISASNAIQVGQSALTCGSGLKGAIRYSNTSNTLEYCNSVTWVPTGNITDTSLTAFTVTKNAIQTGIAAGAVVTWEAAITNNGGAFNLSTERFTAPVSGYYYFNASLLTNNDNSTGDFQIYKNGSATGLRGYGSNNLTAFKPSVAQGVLYLSAGDYVDVRSYAGTQTAYGGSGSSTSTFSGFLLNGGATGGGGGTATPAGVAGDIQFNDGSNLAADTGQLFWDATNNRLGIGTTAPTAGLHVSGTMAVSGSDIGLDAGRGLVSSAGGRLATGPGGSTFGAYAGATSGANIFQWFTSDSTQVGAIRANGYMGIGTTNPSEPLHVGNGTDGGRLFVGEDGSNRRGLLIAANKANELSGATYPPYARIAAYDYASGTSIPLAISPHPNAKVSIGKLNPQAVLDVAGTISASDAIQVSGSSLTCNSGLKGAMRYSNTSSTIEYCQGTAWVSMGPSATDVPAFFVELTGGNQVVPTSTMTKVNFNNVVMDTYGAWDSTQKRFQPTVRGKYLITANVTCWGDTGYCIAVIFKNGSRYVQNQNNSTSGTKAAGATAIVDMNGTTDYIEGWGYNGGGTNIYGSLPGYTYLTGALIASGNGLAGGGGGTASPAGSAGDIQYNDGSNLAADTGQLFWDATNNRLGIGTNVPSTTLDVSGSVGNMQVTSDGAHLRLTRAGNNYIQASSQGGNLFFGVNGNADLSPALFISSAGKVGISTTSPVTQLDVNGEIKVGSTGLACSSGVSGAIRYSNTSSTIEYCQGTAWVSMGPSATTVAFQALRNTSMSSGGTITYSSEITDTQNAFNPATGVFTAPVSGVYLFSWGAIGASTPDVYRMQFRKNGSTLSGGELRIDTTATGADLQSGDKVFLVPMSAGETAAIYLVSDGGAALVSDANNWIYFGGALMTGGGGSGGGGGATPAGNSNDVQYNSSGVLAADTGNFTYASGLLTAPTISTGGMTVTGQISATYVSSSVVQVGNSSLTCGTNLKGAMRYSNTSSTIEYCQGTAWVSMGPSATNVPAFRVDRNGSAQTVTTSVQTTLDFTNKVFDSYNNFDLATDRFTPTVAGYYLVTASAYCQTAVNYCLVHILKNNASVGEDYRSDNDAMAQVTALVWMNGSTDYLTAAVLNNGGTSIVGATHTTYFDGILIASGNGLAGGGGATPAGSAGDIQFNDGSNLAADTGQLFWDATNNRLGINTSSPGYDLEVSGTIRANTVIQTSDKRLKKNILPFGEGLAVVEKLNPVSFKWKSDGRAAKGFIAQDVEGVLPTAVFTDGDGMKGVDFNQLMPVVVNALKELKALNDNLSAEVFTLKAANDNARTDNAALLRRVEALERKAGGAR